MAMLDLKDEQVIELVRQLSKPARAEALRSLLADADWEALLDYGQSCLDRELTRRGLDRSRMMRDEVEAAIEHIADAR